MTQIGLYSYILSTSKYGEGVPELQGVDNSIQELQSALSSQNSEIYLSSKTSHMKSGSKAA